MTKYRQFRHEDSILEQITRAISAIEELLSAIEIHTTVDGAILVPDDWQCRRAIQDAASLAHYELHGLPG